ncbi:hypothetical protein [Hymenobacter sp. 5516J-16]|uniref:aldose epimerase family protein n=1 Tax=Hymenobacter sp. 5516J-16 TaxID=2932253 RepID=UPI0039784A26
MTKRNRVGAWTSRVAGLLLVASCNQSAPNEHSAAGASQTMTDSTQTATTTAASAPTSASFGKTSDGTEVQLYTLTNAHGLQVSITNYGGTVTSLLVPDKAGKLGDVVLGFDNVSGYQSPEFLKSGPYFGALIGRYGNRIAKGKFTLDGKEYTLAKNNGANTLHGAKRASTR